MICDVVLFLTLLGPVHAQAYCDLVSRGEAIATEAKRLFSEIERQKEGEDRLMRKAEEIKKKHAERKKQMR